ncbi:MAG: hypothetical protein GY722_05115 [bacterium]|nr:hypothetical protein [bacterium]
MGVGKMIGGRAIVISEWDWFRARLDLNSLDRSRRGERKIFYSEGDPEEGDPLLVCRLSVPHDDMILRRDDESELEVWRLVEEERRQLDALVFTLQGLKDELSLDLHVSFEVWIMTAHDSEAVCRIMGRELVWY